LQARAETGAERRFEIACHCKVVERIGYLERASGAKRVSGQQRCNERRWHGSRCGQLRAKD
jgi:hypothetical protein